VGASAVVPVAAGKARVDQPGRETFTAPACAV
jgi:xanthine dehydrogenase accessory factor